MILYRQRMYADNGENQGMSRGKKIALGLGATAAATAGTLALGYKGKLGGNFQARIGRNMAGLGQRIGNTSLAGKSSGISNLADKMKINGSMAYGQGKATAINKTLASKGKQVMDAAQLNAKANKIGGNLLNAVTK